MSEINQVSEDMRRHIFDFLMPLQTTREIKEEVFEELDKSSRELARLLKGSEQLPRAVLDELYMAAKTLVNEAPHSPMPDLVQQMAVKLYMTFDLILGGECHEDRQAGIPRVK